MENENEPVREYTEEEKKKEAFFTQFQNILKPLVESFRELPKELQVPVYVDALLKISQHVAEKFEITKEQALKMVMGSLCKVDAPADVLFAAGCKIDPLLMLTSVFKVKVADKLEKDKEDGDAK